jgi:hypothetical protein
MESKESPNTDVWLTVFLDEWENFRFSIKELSDRVPSRIIKLLEKYKGDQNLEYLIDSPAIQRDIITKHPEIREWIKEAVIHQLSLLSSKDIQEILENNR